MTLLHRHRPPWTAPGAGLRSRGRSRTASARPVPILVPVVPHPEHRPRRAPTDQRTVELPVRARGLSLRDLGELYDR